MPFGCLSGIVQSRQRQEIAVLSGEKVPDLLASTGRRLPLIESTARNDTALKAQGLAEGGLRFNALGARVDQRRASWTLLRPGRDEPPTAST